MAKIQSANNTTSTSSDAKRKAAAWINVSIIGKGDVKKNLGGVPLYEDNELHAKILAHVDAGNKVTLECDVNVVESLDNFEL